MIGSVHGRRSMGCAPPRSRRRCSCGCGARATHVGFGDGVALMRGCELYVRRWVRRGAKVSHETIRARERLRFFLCRPSREFEDMHRGMEALRRRREEG
jgi:hypothetical protein